MNYEVCPLQDYVLISFEYCLYAERVYVLCQVVINMMQRQASLYEADDCVKESF